MNLKGYRYKTYYVYIHYGLAMHACTSCMPSDGQTMCTVVSLPQKVNESERKVNVANYKQTIYPQDDCVCNVRK